MLKIWKIANLLQLFSPRLTLSQLYHIYPDQRKILLSTTDPLVELILARIKNLKGMDYEESQIIFIYK